MKIWKIISPNILTTEDRPDNISADTQAKVKVTKVLFSENEVRAYRGIPKPKYPLVPGRFAVGVVSETGEGCLSVDKVIDGYVPRPNKVTIHYWTVDGEEKTIRLKGYPAIVSGHEIDHLNGHLFYDRINKKNPFELADDTIVIY